MAYARDTKVSVDRSKAELEHMLKKYGCSSFAWGWDEETGDRIGFSYEGRSITFRLPPPPEDEWRFFPSGQTRPHGKQAQARAQCLRARWRALVLVIKAKLEAVEAGIVAFEDEFLAHTVLPSGRTIGDELAPQLEVMVEGGKMPKLLGDGR